MDGHCKSVNKKVISSLKLLFHKLTILKSQSKGENVWYLLTFNFLVIRDSDTKSQMYFENTSHTSAISSIHMASIKGSYDRSPDQSIGLILPGWTNPMGAE